MAKTTKKKTAKKKTAKKKAAKKKAAKKKAQLKTRKNDGDVGAFLDAIEDESKRADAKRVCEMMRKATGAEPKMWGASIVGFGSVHLRYESGRELDWFLVGFSPRKQNLTLYIMPGFSGYEGLREKLGKHKTGKSCLYLKRLSDVDLKVLEKMVVRSVKDMRKRWD